MHTVLNSVKSQKMGGLGHNLFPAKNKEEGNGKRKYKDAVEKKYCGYNEMHGNETWECA